jgi:micrococcal nuclease
MKHVIFILLAVCSIQFAVAQQEARVLRVKDGDTFVAKWKGKTFTCRLENVDAPELTQAYGYDSYRALSDLILGKKILVNPHKVDLYGRTLVGVKINHQRLDSILIRDGFAWLYVNYCNESLLKQCMQEAIEGEAGLWSCGKDKACPPWLYRHYSYNNKLKYCKGCN